MNPEPTLPDHSDRAHAVFGPSSLKYYAKCAGYHGRDGTNPAAEMGTRIHEALEVRDPSALQNEQEQQIYDTMLKEELEVFEQLFGGTDGVTILREHRLVLSLPVQTPTFGTSDIVSYKGNIGLQIDYKTGVSKIDEVRDNWQAKAYVVGMFQQFQFLERIHFVFLIPQRGEVLADYFTRDELPRLIEEIAVVIGTAEKIRPKWDTGTPELDELGPSVNCRFCRHEDTCPALGAVAVAVARKYNPLGIPDGPIDSTNVSDPQVLGKLFVVAKILEEWASGIKRKAVLLAESGVEFDELKLRSMGSLKKTVDSNGLAELAMEHGLTQDEVLAAASLTMSQLSEALGNKAVRGRKTAVIRSFEEDALDRGIVEVGPTRYTLSSK
jgi:hypothetical protein